MAYLRSIKRKCFATACERTATEELVGFRNEAYGVYCGRHAQAALRDLAKSEQEYHARNHDGITT
jgi:hypothetical protein